MGLYLKRYLDGDCETVWPELIDLGESALQPKLLDDATAVAEEMVRRIIHNANTVGQYLVDAGYEFKTPGPFVIPADEATAQSVQQIEQEFGQLPLLLKVWWSRVDHFNHLPTERQQTSGLGCPTEGIYPTGGILITSPNECLENSRQRAIDIRERLKQVAEAGITGEDEYYADMPNLVLGPVSSGNDRVGYQLPLRAVDGMCHWEDGVAESLVDWLRFYYLKRGGLGWQFFGYIPTSGGGKELRCFIRPENEVESAVKSMDLIPF